MTPQNKQLPIKRFKDQNDWASWLDKHHADSMGVWLKIAKKNSRLKSVSYDEALETALCYGWIDGQKQADDESFWLQKFTPRGAKSAWSKINRTKVEQLIERGLVKPAGLQVVASAKQDGRWDGAYDSARRASVPKDFQLALNRNAQAKAFFETLKGANRYAILYRIQTAKKAETRAKRIQQFIEMLEKNKTIY